MAELQTGASKKKNKVKGKIKAKTAQTLGSASKVDQLFANSMTGGPKASQMTGISMPTMAGSTTMGQAYKPAAFDSGLYARGDDAWDTMEKFKNRRNKKHVGSMYTGGEFDYTDNLAREAERVKNLPEPDATEEPKKKKPKTTFGKLDSNRY